MKLPEIPVPATAPMACATTCCSIIPAGSAIAAAMTAGGMIQQMTMAIICRGVIPTALNTPRSCTRSRVSISTEFSTPSPASTAITTVSRPIMDASAVAANDEALCGAATTPNPGPRMWPRPLTYAYVLVPGLVTRRGDRNGRARTRQPADRLIDGHLVPPGLAPGLAGNPLPPDMRLRQRLHGGILRACPLTGDPLRHRHGLREDAAEERVEVVRRVAPVGLHHLYKPDGRRIG